MGRKDGIGATWVEMSASGRAFSVRAEVCEAREAQRAQRPEGEAEVKAEDAQSNPNDGILVLKFPRAWPAKTIAVTGKSA